MKHNLGQFYDKSSDFQHSQFLVLIDLMKAHIDSAAIKDVFEIGAGSGARTLKLLEEFPEVERTVAIEPDPEMLSVAMSKYADPRIEYHQCAAEGIQSLDLPHHSFDLFFSNWVVHWIEDKGKMLQDLDQLLRVQIPQKNGYFAFSTCERLPNILTDLDHYIRAELMLPASHSYPWYYLTVEEWQDLLQQHGWRIVAHKAYPADHYVDDAGVYLDHWFAASTAKFLYGQQMEQVSELSISDALWFMEQKYGDSQKPGGLYFQEDVLFVIAQKI